MSRWAVWHSDSTASVMQLMLSIGRLTFAAGVAGSAAGTTTVRRHLDESDFCDPMTSPAFSQTVPTATDVLGFEFGDQVSHALISCAN
eukprot:SAG11_NODE_24713_length_369_cov_0.818519_1_plen_87_part_01